MLDKSLPYRDIIMKMSAAEAAGQKAGELPQGFFWHFYEPGDEKKWAYLETRVKEFDSEKEALDFFLRNFGTSKEELKKRCLFILDEQGRPAATAMAWHTENEKRERIALMQWISADPDFQGRGLGKAVVKRALSLFQELEPGLEVYIHTQTWSTVAVPMYRKLGYHLCKSESFYRTRDGVTRLSPNDCEEALSILGTVLSEEQIALLRASAV